MLYVGIDIGKRSHRVYLNGRTFAIANNKKGFNSLKVKLAECNQDITIGMEGTGHYFLNLYYYLTESGFHNLVVLNPLQVKAFQNTNIRGLKTDDEDAKRIARLLSFGDYRASRVSSGQLLGLRELTRFRADIIAEIGNTKRKLITVLDRIFPEFETIFKRVYGKTAISILDRYATPERIARASTTKLEQIITKTSRKKMRSEKAGELKQSARDTVGIQWGMNGFSLEMKLLIERIKHLESQVKEIEHEIKQSMPASRLETITGFGPITAAVFLAEVGDISQLTDGRSVVALAGLDPKRNDSGERQGKAHLSKRGSRYLRTALYNASLVAAAHSQMFQTIYKRHKDKGKSHKEALIAVANKLARVGYSVLKNDLPFKEQSEILKKRSATR